MNSRKPLNFSPVQVFPRLIEWKLGEDSRSKMLMFRSFGDKQVIWNPIISIPSQEHKDNNNDDHTAPFICLNFGLSAIVFDQILFGWSNYMKFLRVTCSLLVELNSGAA